MQDAVLARVIPILREELLLRLRAEPTAHVFCVDWVEAIVREVGHALAACLMPGRRGLRSWRWNWAPSALHVGDHESVKGDRNIR